ncbi:MAG: hypothetical protein M1834_006617 [Cirrosporium novae-zelandiae]|nr:MAG: hypothetical protein M1834_006617 [Cirrosporium novae-zelandiae]
MTSSTLLRSTPGFTVPPTQNTAPVLEFRCLYTHDLVRKQKRWQDGFLTFHTFNKRLMVYDERRNYIGDSHCRDESGVQDGDELELDKGVLVQVQEEVRKTETDISELFEKRKAGRQSHSKALPSGPTPTSSLAPKSLSQVLGTPRGRLGRACLPSKSPFQLRHEVLQPPSFQERPAKRQRLDTRTENITPKSATITSQAKPSIIQGGNARINPFSSATTSLANPGFASNAESHQQEEDLDIEREPSPRKVARSREKKQVQGSPTTRTKSSIKPAKIRRKDPIQKKRPARQQTPQEETPIVDLCSPPVSTTNRLPPVSGSLIDPNLIDHNETLQNAEKAAPAGREERRLNILQMAHHKPRRKLMYRALLPTSISSINQPLSNPSRLDAIIEPKLEDEPKDEPEDSIISKFQCAQQARIKARLEKANQRNNNQRRQLPKSMQLSPTKDSNPAPETDNSLFFPGTQRPHAHHEILFSSLFSDDLIASPPQSPRLSSPSPQSPKPTLSGIKNDTAGPFTLISPPRPPTSRPLDHPPLAHVAKPALPTVQGPPATTYVPCSPPMVLDSAPLFHSRISKPTLPPIPRKKQPPLSHLSNPQPQLQPHPMPRHPSPPTPASVPAPPQEPSRRKSTRIQTSISDTTASTTTVQKQKEKTKDLGPWSAEAFDLFGKPPRGREGLFAKYMRDDDDNDE